MEYPSGDFSNFSWKSSKVFGEFALDTGYARIQAVFHNQKEWKLFLNESWSSDITIIWGTLKLSYVYRIQDIQCL